MNINLTFVIQIAHFFIAYGILEKFFLRPCVQVIQDEEGITQAVALQMINTEKNIAEKHKAIKLLWQDFKSANVKLMPLLYKKFITFKEYPFKNEALDHEAQRTHVNDLVNYVVSRVNHVAE